MNSITSLLGHWARSLWSPDQALMCEAALVGYVIAAIVTRRRGKLSTWSPMLLFVPAVSAIGPLVINSLGLLFFILTLGGDIRVIMAPLGAFFCLAAGAFAAVLASRPRTHGFRAACWIFGILLVLTLTYHLSNDKAAEDLRSLATCDHRPLPPPPPPVVAHGVLASDMRSLVVLAHPRHPDHLQSVPPDIQVVALGYVYDALARTGLAFIEFPLSDEEMKYPPTATDVRELGGSLDTRLLRFTLRHRAAGIDCRAWDAFHRTLGGWDADPTASPLDECVVVESAAAPAADVRLSTRRIDAKSGYEVTLDAPDRQTTNTLFIVDPWIARWCEQGEAVERFLSSLQVAGAAHSTAP